MKEELSPILINDLHIYFKMIRNTIYNNLFTHNKNQKDKELTNYELILKKLFDPKFRDCILDNILVRNQELGYRFIHKRIRDTDFYFKHDFRFDDMIESLRLNRVTSLHLNRINDCYIEVAHCKNLVDTTGCDDITIITDVRHLNYLRMVLVRFKANPRCATYKQTANTVTGFLEVSKNDIHDGDNS